MTADRKLTTRDLQTVFGVSSMSLFLWRKGTPTKSKLPTVKANAKAGERGVMYDPGAIVKWAEKNGVPIAKHPSKLKATPANKPGPKARVAAKKVVPLRRARVAA